ncbi:MAG TPA: peptide-methionine (S)-S-oxide reductase MsrA [Flavobacteriales bacterium]|nr:peptide-methionine (S)-S-oxide reductase MsrA [Flavobacteriales bacterium]
MNRRFLRLLPIAVALNLQAACGTPAPDPMSHPDLQPAAGTATDIITLGAGCFWCVEAVFSELKGVLSVTSGYMGGHVKNPSYKEVCNGTTGHAEVAQLVFDPAQVSLTEILEVFWQTHDPTTLNRQGADVGTQYRSAIFFHDNDQRVLAEDLKKQLDASGAFRAPIVTEITAASDFYKAEDYHQDYYALNGSQGYCQMVIRPKLEKFRKVFADKLKEKR